MNSRLSQNGNFFVAVQKIVGFAPGELDCYYRAFTHSSLQEKDKYGEDLNYERLEFLGDAVLGAVVAAYLFEKLPQAKEGYLTQMRSKIVSRRSLNQLGAKFGLEELMISGNNQDQLGNNVCGNLLEALIGAIYVDKGYSFCDKFIRQKVIRDCLDIDQLQEKIISFKGYLIEWCQKEKKTIFFETLKKRKENDPFSVQLFISGRAVARASSSSKKKAEEKAAKRAYLSLSREEGAEPPDF